METQLKQVQDDVTQDPTSLELVNLWSASKRTEIRSDALSGVRVSNAADMSARKLRQRPRLTTRRHVAVKVNKCCLGWVRLADCKVRTVEWWYIASYISLVGDEPGINCFWQETENWDRSRIVKITRVMSTNGFLTSDRVMTFYWSMVSWPVIVWWPSIGQWFLDQWSCDDLLLVKRTCSLIDRLTTFAATSW